MAGMRTAEEVMIKLLTLIWVLVAAGVILVLTPLTFIELYRGNVQASALFALVLVPNYYFMLSVYFEHILERRFHVNPRYAPGLQHSSDIFSYCRSRREVLRDVLDKLGASRPSYQRLLSLHEMLGWACVVEIVILVAWAILQQVVE